MNHYAGKRSIGPFGKLLEVAAEVGWSIEVPGFYDHDGFWVSFLDITDGALRGIAEDAWCQHVAREVNRRKDFEGLVGFDISCLQSGTKATGCERAQDAATSAGWVVLGCQCTKQI